MRFRLHFTFLDLIDSTVMKLTKQMNHKVRVDIFA